MSLMSDMSQEWLSFPETGSTMIHSRCSHPDRSTNSEDASASVVIGVGGLVDLVGPRARKKKRVGWGSPQAMLMCHDVSSVSGTLCSQQNQWCHPKHVVMPCYAIIQ
jgi:hypothetical protein